MENIVFVLLIICVAVTIFCIQRVTDQDEKIKKMKAEINSMKEELEKIHRYMIQK